MQFHNINSVCKGNNPVSSLLFELKPVVVKGGHFPCKTQKKKEVVGETNKIVWSQSVELLLALEAMEIEQTDRDNILYLLDTEVLFSLSLSFQRSWEI